MAPVIACGSNGFEVRVGAVVHAAASLAEAKALYMKLQYAPKVATKAKAPKKATAYVPLQPGDEMGQVFEAYTWGEEDEINALELLHG